MGILNVRMLFVFITIEELDMTDTLQKDKDPVVYSSRRKRSLKRLRLMDIDKSANSDQLPPETPIAIYSRVSSEEQVHG